MYNQWLPIDAIWTRKYISCKGEKKIRLNQSHQTVRQYEVDLFGCKQLQK